MWKNMCIRNWSAPFVSAYVSGHVFMILLTPCSVDCKERRSGSAHDTLKQWSSDCSFLWSAFDDKTLSRNPPHQHFRYIKISVLNYVTTCI
jgi:hypothetical protein